MLVRHVEASNKVFTGLLAAELSLLTTTRNTQYEYHAENRKAALRGLCFSLPMCFLAFYLALFPYASRNRLAYCRHADAAQTPRPSSRKTNPRDDTPEELEALVAPIALYLLLLIKSLAASTYPLEIVQLKQWLDENKKLKGKALAEAVVQQNWDPSVQALAAFPVVVNKLANKIQWTTDLGNVFLAQQSDVMDAVQRLRAKAQANGALKTNDKQKVATETTDHGAQAITIEPVQQDVVYVPTYNTQAVYGDSDSSNYSGDSGYSNASGYSGYSNSSSGYSDDGYSYVGYALAAAGGYAWGYYNWRDRYASVNYDNYYNKSYSRNWNNKVNNNWNNKVNNASNNVSNWNRGAANSSSRVPTQGQGAYNTIRPIAETPLMAMAISRTGSDKITIAFPEARVIEHRSQ
jgi:hypothetical protein